MVLINNKENEDNKENKDDNKNEEKKIQKKFKCYGCGYLYTDRKYRSNHWRKKRDVGMHMLELLK